MLSYKHNNKLLKFCNCKKCLNILVRHILNVCDIKIKLLKNKSLGKINHKSI